VKPTAIARRSVCAIAFVMVCVGCTSAQHVPVATQSANESSPTTADASSGPSGASSAAAGHTSTAAATPGPAVTGGAITAGLVPLPVNAATDEAASFTIGSDTTIEAGPGDGTAAVATDLAELLRPPTGFALPISTGAAVSPPKNSIVLRLGVGNPTLGDEGYDLTISKDGVLLTAMKAAGLFHGVQTIRQLLPPAVEVPTSSSTVWKLTGGHIVDYPRYSYRGAMLDVSRHFFGVPIVERYIDELALYKVNVLHLHLSDDQGWRLAVDGWPNLTAIGGSTEVGGGQGGFYTKADYTEIVTYAQAHFITVIPEIDTPSHTNAALASYPQLNCNGTSPPLYTGERVGFSSLCVPKAVTYTFIDNVVSELAALTPGPYIHLGGDEAQSTSAADYVTFVQKAQAIVEAHGKLLMGWAEISKAKLDQGSVAEYWNFNDHGRSATDATHQNVKVVMAPADHAYLDQKYDSQTVLGLTWAGAIEAQDAYAWDPLDGGHVSESDVLGVEAPLWSETLHTVADLEYLAWPRMAGIAEIGWSPKAERSWPTYRTRLAEQAPRWTAMGINFYRSPQVDWTS
jgi:hexosaminidase